MFLEQSIPSYTSEDENTTLGCVSIIRNRLFCGCKSKKQINAVESDHPKELEMKVGVSPGIVARLMGLEWMPEPEPNWVPKQRSTLDSVHRSRSVNSIDYWSKFDPIQGFHRRVKTSVSFRDLPTFIEVDNNELLLVRPKIVSEKKRNEPKERITRVRGEGVVQRKEKKEKQAFVTSRPIRNAVTSPRLANQRRVRDRGKQPQNAATPKKNNFNREKLTKKDKCSIKKDQLNSSLESLCVKPRTHLPEMVKKRSLNPRRKQPRHSIDIMNAVRNKKRTKSNQSVWKSGRGVWKLEEEDLGSLMWKPRVWQGVHIKEIGIEFGLKILDRLVHEVVAELSGLSMESLGLLLMDDDL